MQPLKYKHQNCHNWYLNLKMAQLEAKVAGNIADKIFGGAFGALATSILMTALHRVNPPLYDQVQNKEITIEQAAQQEVSNKSFIEEVVKMTPEGALDDGDDNKNTIYDQDDEKENSSVSSYIHGWEGFLSNPKVLAGEDFYTVGIGHRLDGSQRSRKAFQKALPGKDYNSFFNGNGEINEDEAQLLFEQDVPDYIERAKELTGDKFDLYSKNLQKNIISATFRGSWGYSPKARGLLSEGKYEEAAVEFLNSDEYRNAEELGRPGIIPRMDAVADAIRQEARYQNWTAN